MICKRLNHWYEKREEQILRKKEKKGICSLWKTTSYGKWRDYIYGFRQQLLPHCWRITYLQNPAIDFVANFGKLCIMINCDNSHLTKLAKWCIARIWVSFTEWHPVSIFYVLNPKTSKIYLNKCTTFLDKSYNEWDSIVKPVLFQLVTRGQMMKASKQFPKIMMLIMTVM